MLKVCKISEERHGYLYGKVPTACHIFTCYRLYQAEFSRRITLEQFQDYFLNSTAFIRSLLQYGRALTRPEHVATQLVPYSVMVMVSDGEPKHFFLSRTETETGGYNQMGWFPGGKNHMYSKHATSELNWNGKETVLAHGCTCRLIEVPELIARAVVRTHVLSNKQAL